jgi:hypothetical protein
VDSKLVTSGPLSPSAHLTPPPLAYPHYKLSLSLSLLSFSLSLSRALDERCLPGAPPPDDSGEGGALCHRRSTAVPVGPPRPSSITHPEAAPATVTCSYTVCWHKWILGWGNLVHDTTTTRRSSFQNTWAGWGSMPVFFFPGMAGHLCLTLRARSLSLQGDPANIGKG